MPKSKNDKKRLISALEKKAFGYSVEERSVEYDNEGNEIKNRVVIKDVPPDLSAIKLLLDLTDDELELTEDELIRERDRLLKELSRLNKIKVKG